MEEIKEILKKIQLSEKREQLPFSFLPMMYSKISSKELLHSEIIATLLRPKGEHNLGILPLEKFLTALGIDNYDDFGKDLSITKVQTERGVEGRRIDILLINDKNAIIIENKLNDAVDQVNQLCDYTKSIQSEGYNVLKVVYLPFYEHKSAKEKVEGVDVVNVSPTGLINWLKECKKPICISYAELLKYMNQSNRNYMDAKKIQTKLGDEELSKIIDIANIINSPDWKICILSEIENEVRSKLQGFKIKSDIKENRFLQLWVENPPFWVEIYLYTYELCLYIAKNDDKECKTMIPIEDFDFVHDSWNAKKGYNYFAEEGMRKSYKYPCKKDFEKLIKNVCEILKVSHIQQ